MCTSIRTTVGAHQQSMSGGGSIFPVEPSRNHRHRGTIALHRGRLPSGQEASSVQNTPWETWYVCLTNGPRESATSMTRSSIKPATFIYSTASEPKAKQKHACVVRTHTALQPISRTYVAVGVCTFGPTHAHCRGSINIATDKLLCGSLDPCELYTTLQLVRRP